MRKIILLLALQLCGCYGNYRHANRMYDSSMLYYHKCREYASRSEAAMYGTDTGALQRSKDLLDISQRYFNISEIYADSFRYYDARKFQKEEKR